MSILTPVFVLLTIIIVTVTYRKINEVTKPLKAPILNLDQYWGKGEKTAYDEDKSIKPQEVYYSDNTINSLTNKLNETLTLHYPLEGVKHEYGLNSYTLINLVEYWRNEYMPKWSERLELLNSVPHYQTQIQG